MRELNTHGAINAEEVYELINKYDSGNGEGSGEEGSERKVNVSKEQIDILFKILDVDGMDLC